MHKKFDLNPLTFVTPCIIFVSKNRNRTRITIRYWRDTWLKNDIRKGTTRAIQHYAEANNKHMYAYDESTE